MTFKEFKNTRKLT